MDPNTLKLAQLNSFLQRAHTAPLGLTARTPPIPPPTEYAQPWPLYPELCSPEVSRALIQVHRFDEIGQSLEVNAHKFVNSIGDSLYIDWNANEANNLKMPAPGITVMSTVNYDRLKADDVNTFTLAVYTSIVVTAMECVRILQDKEYDKSARWAREFEIFPARGAEWDILLYKGSPKGSSFRKDSMAVLCVPPWACSKLDLEEFATAGILPPGLLDFKPGSLQNTNALLMWAIVHEVCKKTGVQYFIVTTYDYWVFGNMSPGRTTASISRVLDFSSHDDTLRTPNLLQLVTYWSLLSIGEEKGWQLPRETPGFIRPHC